jgi:hypothetical protein
MEWTPVQAQTLSLAHWRPTTRSSSHCPCVFCIRWQRLVTLNITSDGLWVLDDWGLETQHSLPMKSLQVHGVLGGCKAPQEQRKRGCWWHGEALAQLRSDWKGPAQMSQILPTPLPGSEKGPCLFLGHESLGMSVGNNCAINKHHCRCYDKAW